MSLRTFIIVVLLLWQTLGGFSASHARQLAEGPIDLEADQLDLDEATGLYHARGRVRLSQGDLELISEQLWWNQQTGEVEALGEVKLTTPGEELSGRRLTYDLQKGTGLIEEGEGYWAEKSLRLSGRRLERNGPGNYRVYDGRLTLCDGERPAWSVGVRQADVSIGRYLTAKHALVYVKDIPVFYTPYLVLPIKSDRESGFLMPSLGFSDRRGTEFSTAWYQVLGRNMDVTFYLDHLSSLGTGLGAEYRYIFDHSQRGKFNLYTVFARDETDRRSFNWEHFGQINDNLRLVIDSEYVNERDYFVDYGDVAGEYNEQKVITNLFVNQTLKKASLTLQFKAIKDLESDTVPPWQAAPHVDFSIAPWKIGSTPVYFGLQSSYTRFERNQGSTGQRMMVRPSLGVHSYLSAGLEINSEIGYRQRRYLEIDDSLTSSVGTADVQLGLSSRFFKVYGEGSRRWLHSIEPELNYQYEEGTLGEGQPDFDRYDLVERRNAAGYALVSRLTGKWTDSEGTETQREVLWAKFSQDFRFREAGADSNDLSEIRVQLIFRPAAKVSLDLDAYYDVDQSRVPDFTLGGTYKDGKGNGLSIDYSKWRPLNGLNKVDNLNFTLDTSWLKPLYLGYEQRYDLLESSSLEQVISVEWRKQCWGLKTVFRDREDDRSVMLVLTLSGIGETGRFGTSY